MFSKAIQGRAKNKGYVVHCNSGKKKITLQMFFFISRKQKAHNNLYKHTATN